MMGGVAIHPGDEGSLVRVSCGSSKTTQGWLQERIGTEDHKDDSLQVMAASL